VVAGAHAKAAAEFEKLIVHSAWTGWGVFAPLAQLGLAHAYAVQGNLASSRKAYDDFFTTWKDADPNTPILCQAKAEFTTASVAASASAKKQ
jgi:hypothetical protein